MITQTAQRLDSHFCIALQPFHQVHQNDYVLIFFDDYSTFSTFANIVPTLLTDWSHFQPSMLLLLPLLKLHDIVPSLPSKHHILAPPSEPTLFSGVPPRIPQSHLKTCSSPQFIQPEFFEKKKDRELGNYFTSFPTQKYVFCCRLHLLRIANIAMAAFEGKCVGMSSQNVAPRKKINVTSLGSRLRGRQPTRVIFSETTEATT